MLLLIEGNFTIELRRAGFFTIFGARASAIDFADDYVGSDRIEGVSYYFLLCSATLSA